MLRKAFLWMQTYERHLSAFAMVAGFVIDNLFFTRIDLAQTQLVFAAYAAACFISIAALHYLEERSARQGVARPRFSVIFPLITQFALGGFWSGFVIFYWRSAVFGVSWPFLLLLLLVFIGSEYFQRYHARLVFTSVLFFFAIYSLAIFMVPIYTGTLGALTFLLSGAVAMGVFAMFTILLRSLGRERFLADIWRIRAGALVVLIVVNVSYFTNILPPLPLSAQEAGIYHEVWRVPGAYMARSEPQPWQVRYLGFPPTVHGVLGKSLFAYSSIFAPTTLATTVVHRWQWYDPKEKKWVVKSSIRYPIVGGRESGYRGYTAMPINTAGRWRVDIETADGRVVARLPFTVEETETEPFVETVTLR